QLDNIEKQSLNWINIKKLGAKGDGITDDTNIIISALEKYDTIYFPSGTYLVNDIINVLPGKKMIGENKNYTKIKSSANKIINIKGNYIALEEITFIGNNNNIGLTVDDINTPKFSRLNLKNIHFSNVLTGLDFSGYLCYFENVSINNCENGFKINRGTTFKFIGCYVNQCSIGYSLGCVYSVAINCACDYCSEVCYQTTSYAKNINFISCGAENFNKKIISLNSSWYITFNGVDITVLSSSYNFNGMIEFISCIGCRVVDFRLNTLINVDYKVFIQYGHNNSISNTNIKPFEVKVSYNDNNKLNHSFFKFETFQYDDSDLDEYGNIIKTISINEFYNFIKINVGSSQLLQFLKSNTPIKFIINDLNGNNQSDKKGDLQIKKINNVPEIVITSQGNTNKLDCGSTGIVIKDNKSIVVFEDLTLWSFWQSANTNSLFDISNSTVVFKNCTFLGTFSNGNSPLHLINATNRAKIYFENCTMPTISFTGVQTDFSCEIFDSKA
uniref:glycosyl hydrolase family 28-related protein n=1 Tax=Clostridium sp. D53t1_180928_C8 TaxID=2787101 RepID=UPI0018A920A3